MDPVQVPSFEDALNIIQTECSVIEECAIRIIKEGFTEVIDNNGTNRLLR